MKICLIEPKAASKQRELFSKAKIESGSKVTHEKGAPEDLRLTYITEKLKNELTNIEYSLNYMVDLAKNRHKLSRIETASGY